VWAIVGTRETSRKTLACIFSVQKQTADRRGNRAATARVEDALLHRHLSDRGGAAMGDDKKQPHGSLNEGEGSKTADEQYRKGATDFAKRTDTLKKAVEAEREVENYRDEYERAEKTGRSHSAGDLESDLEGKNDGRV
jgi:hypothetical protein